MRVTIVQEHLPHYRVRFYELLRELLSAEGVRLDLVYDPRTASNLLAGKLPWATPVRMRRCFRAAWHPLWPFINGSDLVIVPQETKYLSTYLLLLQRVLGKFKFAFWGHGRNFQARNPRSASEKLKRFVSLKCDWWFAYNDLSAQVVKELGFPVERITSVQNAVDVQAMSTAREALNHADMLIARQELGLIGDNVAVFAGGLYDDKRLPFLVQACDLVRQKISDFELIVIGKGPREDVILEAAKSRLWIHPVGPKGDLEKIRYWCQAKLCLMPGAVGLVVLDSFALRTPMVTTAFPYHGPEFVYLLGGINGVVVPEWESSEAYANAVVELLLDEPRRIRLVEAGLSVLEKYTIQNMSRNFASGILACLGLSSKTMLRSST